MLRIGFYVAVVVILLAVRSSEAANCSLTTYTQGIDAAKLQASQIIASEYATSTKDQIMAQLKNVFNDTVVSFDYTIVQTGDTINITYKIVSACNDTSTTTLSDGSTKTTSVTSSVNQAQVQSSIQAGLYL